MHSQLSGTLADLNGGLSIAELLGRSNYVAIVGGGKQPRYPPNKVGKIPNNKVARSYPELTSISTGDNMG